MPNKPSPAKKLSHRACAFATKPWQWRQSFNLEQAEGHAGCHAQIAWKHPCQAAIIGTGSWKLNIGEFGAMLTNAWRTHHTLTGQGETTTLEVMGSTEWMQAVGLEWEEPVPAGFPLLMGRPFRSLNAQMKEWIEEILFNDFIGDFQAAYRAETLQQLLMALIEETDRSVPTQVELSPFDREAVLHAAQHIRANSPRHCSIGQIAREVGMNDCRLKKIFQQEMRMGMHEYLIDLRLNEIRRELLHTKKPIKALYEQAGYASMQGFITGFRRHFGCAPGALRR